MSQPAAAEASNPSRPLNGTSPSVAAWTRTIWFSLAAVVMLPLALAFVQTPVQSSDVLTGPDMFYSPKGDFTSAKEILPNYAHGLFRSTYLVRPTQVLLNNVQYVLFGPEPGAMYAIKWAMKFASALLVLAVLKRLGADDLSRYATGALVLFHPACLDPLLWSADGLAAFLMLATLALSLRFAESGAMLRIDRISRWQYLALLTTWFFLLGVKELSFVICGCFVLAWQAAAIRSGRAWLRLTPFYAILAFWTYRLAAARPGSEYALTLSDVASRSWNNLQLICPPSPYGLLGYACLLLIGLALVATFRHGDRRLQWSVAFFAVAAVGGLLFISIPAVRPSARYNITLVYLFALLAGVGMTQLPRLAWPVKPLFVLLMPAMMAGDLYSQALAFVEDMHEYNEALNYLESGTTRGYGIACSGDAFEAEGMFGREAQDTVKYYFEKYGPRFYGLTEPTHVYFLNDGDRPSGSYHLLTTYSPDTLKTGAIGDLDVERISGAVQIVRHRQGLLARMTNRYTRLAHWLGNDHWPVYDCGTYCLTDDSRYFIYAVDGANQRADGPLTVSRVRPTYHAGAFIR